MQRVNKSDKANVYMYVYTQVRTRVLRGKHAIVIRWWFNEALSEISLTVDEEGEKNTVSSVNTYVVKMNAIIEVVYRLKSS